MENLAVEEIKTCTLEVNCLTVLVPPFALPSLCLCVSVVHFGRGLWDTWLGGLAGLVARRLRFERGFPFSDRA